MKNKINFYFKYGLAGLILLLVGLLSINSLFINANSESSIVAKDTVFNTTGYVKSAHIEKQGQKFDTGQKINFGPVDMNLPTKNVRILVTNCDGGGDLRDVYLEDKWFEISNFTSLDIYYIYYGGTLSGVLDISDGNYGLTLYGNTPYFDSPQIKIYYKDQVTDTTEPMIDSEKYIYVTSVDNPVSINNMMVAVQLTAIDAIDGDLTDEIVVTSDGNYNANVYSKTPVSARILGDYAINFSVEDFSGNVATATVTIRVVDTQKPVINTGSSTLTYNTGYGSPAITEATIVAGIIATDNFSSVTKSIVENNYTVNANKVGSYTVKVQVRDVVGNSVTTTVTITVYDNVKPIITGANTFYKSYHLPKSVNDIMTFCNIVATDAIDGTMTIANGKLKVLTDNYSGKANIPGVYTIILRATDIKGNYADYTITVTVGDEVIPYFLINKNKVIIESGINFTSQMLVKTLKDVGVIKNESLSFTVTNDTYSGNEDTPGLYNYDLKVLYENGIESYVELDVEVLEATSDGVVVEEENEGFWATIGNILSWIWKILKWPFVFIWNLFKGLFVTSFFKY